MFNIDDIDVISQQDDFITKGTKMWACLDFLAEHYKEADMSKISPVSLFFDDTWDVYGTAENNFLWSKWLPESKHHPLDLVSRIVTYNEIYVVNKKISSIRDAIRAFISTFMEIFTVKGIFIGERNQSFKNLAALSNTDILFIAQTTYSKSGTLCDTPYLGFNCVALCSQSVLPHAEFLLDGCSAPWIEQGISHRVWIKKLKNLGKDHHTVKSYPALSPGVVEALVQRAVPFVDEYFDLIKTVFGEIERLTKLHKKFGNYRVSPYVSCIITAKYGDQLHHILPLRCNVHNGKPVISSKWFTEFEQLIQGAVAWLVLLTTGLRNVDMRNLVKGCCKPSKRFDLLYYLITDIKKTDLQNYVIPVPPRVQKAIELVEIAKIEPNGNILFTLRLAASKDNTSTDRRKIGCSQGFNKLIKHFASSYNIKLQTVSEGDGEATAHCVRTTLAGYIGANSHAAIIILKRLFGHSNNLMPDAYLANNPIIIRQRKEIVRNAQDQQASAIAKAWASGKVAATKGKQLLVGIKHIDAELHKELKNESLTEMDFHVRLTERLKEILLERIRGDDIYALKTPVGVICMRCTSDTTDSPCAKKINHLKRKELNISKDVTDALATLPNPAQCIGKGCPDALMGDPWSDDLLLSFDYYIKLLKGQGHKNIDIVNQAKHYLKAYGPLLKDIYADVREEGYFD